MWLDLSYFTFVGSLDGRPLGSKASVGKILFLYLHGFSLALCFQLESIYPVSIRIKDSKFIAKLTTATAAVATPLPQSPDQQSPSSHSSKDDIQQRVEMAFARFFSTTLFSWCLKGCLLMLFLRLKAANPAMTFLPVTQLQKQQTPRLRRYIQTVAGLTVIFYFAIIIMYMLAFNCHGQIPSDAGSM